MPGALLQERSLSKTNVIAIESLFYWLIQLPLQRLQAIPLFVIP